MHCKTMKKSLAVFTYVAKLVGGEIHVPLKWLIKWEGKKCVLHIWLLLGKFMFEYV